ncbi:MAG TPA: sigma-70 family RNA polymerase sigma factor, partial [Planctomycetota bacterium]|nr:sigma-70 family RNA polymerase sigma factor [Planctomycetota bacterium]
MTASHSPPLEDLLAQVGWIRALSRKLVSDPDLADEVVQQTLVRASSEGPKEASSMRAWLAALVRNFARAGLRSQARRRVHEQRAARPESQPSVHEIVERASAQRELVECVIELDEPYRTTILLRFYEGQSPREIAAAMSVPLATVRTRLARGLALMRARLDRRHGGDRASWAALLAPIPTIHFSPLAPLAAMNLKATLAACALCTAGVVWFLATQAQPTPEVPKSLESGPSNAGLELAQPEAAPLDESQRSEVASEAAANAASSSPTPAAAESATRVHGRVVDVDSHPVAGAAISLVVDAGPTREPIAKVNADPTREPIAKSDAEGLFTIERPLRAARLEVDDERWVTLFSGMVGSLADQRQCTIVVAPGADLSGVVADDLGVPLPGVTLRVRPEFRLRTRFVNDLDASEDVIRTETTDEAGRFAFAHLASCEGLKLSAELPAHVPYDAPLVATDRPFKAITLARLSSGDHLVRGRVLDAGELPIAQAVVALGTDTTRSDNRGEFAFPKTPSLDNWRNQSPTELRALAPGHLPATFTPPLVNGAAQWPEYVTLQLGGKPLELSGRVQRADGKPVAGARVWLVDSTTFGDGPGGMLQTEGWLAGDEENAWHYATTDSEGRFELDGLLEREYELCAVDAATLERVTLTHIAAGRHDVVLELPSDACIPRIEGIAVDSNGAPLPEVKVVPTRMG